VGAQHGERMWEFSMLVNAAATKWNLGRIWWPSRGDCASRDRPTAGICASTFAVTPAMPISRSNARPFKAGASQVVRTHTVNKRLVGRKRCTTANFSALLR
jgi:hypothetical protein